MGWNGFLHVYIHGREFEERVQKQAQVGFPLPPPSLASCWFSLRVHDDSLRVHDDSCVCVCVRERERENVCVCRYIFELTLTFQ